MLNAELSALLRPEAVACSVYPFPSWSMLKSLNRATPFTARTILVPDRTAFPSRLPSCPIATVTKPVKLVTRLPRSSTAVTSTAGVIVAPGAVLLGWTVNTSCVASGGGGARRDRRGSRRPGHGVAGLVAEAEVRWRRRRWRWRGDVERIARGACQARRGGAQGVAGTRLIDAQVRERRDTVHRIDDLRSRETGAARVGAERDRDRPVEGRADVPGSVARRHLHRRRDGRAGLGRPRLLGEPEVRGGRRRWPWGADVEPIAGGASRARGGGAQRVPAAGFIDAQVGERRDTVHRVHPRRAQQGDRKSVV